MDDIGLKAVACRHCTRYGGDEFLCALLVLSLCVCICDVFSCALNDIFHNPLLLSIGPRIIIFPLRLTFTSCNLNSAVNIASHSFPIKKSVMFVILGMIWPSHSF